MRTVVEHILVLLYDVILVAGAGDLLIVAASVGQLSAIDGVVQNTAHKCGGETVQSVVLAFLLLISMFIQPGGNS